MLDKGVDGFGNEHLYSDVVGRTPGTMNDEEMQLKAEMWPRIDGLIDAGGELVRNVKVDDKRDAAFASSRLAGETNEYVLLGVIGTETGGRANGRWTKADRRGMDSSMDS